jgi:hypothetical protein
MPTVVLECQTWFRVKLVKDFIIQKSVEYLRLKNCSPEEQFAVELTRVEDHVRCRIVNKIMTYTVILFPNLCLGCSKLHRLTKKDLNMDLVSAKHEFVFLLDIQMSLNLCLDPSKEDE